MLFGTVWMSLLPQEALGVTRCSPFFQEEREKRRLEQLERKKELQRLLEEEDSKLKGKSPKQVAPGKVTRAQIEESIRKEQQQKENTDTGRGAPRKDPRRGKGERGRRLLLPSLKGWGAWRGRAARSRPVLRVWFLSRTQMGAKCNLLAP